jgi:gamma-glutamyltranspeptidase/glutathione hydrolase
MVEPGHLHGRTVATFPVVPSPLVPFTTVHAPTAMVAAADHLAAQAGLATMARGGNAVDAAVATNAVLAVTLPHLCGMGGDLFALVHDGPGAPVAIDASGRAGSGADPERLRAEGHRSMPQHLDVRTVTVPGCVDGWLALHSRFGRMPLTDVLAPAVAYADDGFPASPLLVAVAARLVEQGNTAPALQALAAQARRAGDLVRRPGAASALRAIAATGRDGFYGGAFGAGLVALGAGEYTDADLAAPLATWVEPLAVEAWGHRLWTIPPASQGYLTLSAAWIADGLPLPADPDDPVWAHLLVEAAVAAAHDRLDVLCEGADGGALVAPERLAPRRAAISADRASGRTAPAGAGDTTYLCAVDGDGMGVSLIQSNASGFGSGLFEPNTGINLHNRGLGFSTVAGHPAEYGPGRRPPHTLSPALVTHLDGRLAAVVGTQGGDGQPQILLQVLARLLHAGQSPADAIGRPRWVLVGDGAGFDTWSSASRTVAIEANAPAGWASGLTARGHQVTTTAAFGNQFGHANLITVADPASGRARLAGVADPRSRISAAVGS